MLQSGLLHQLDCQAFPVLHRVVEAEVLPAEEVEGVDRSVYFILHLQWRTLIISSIMHARTGEPQPFANEEHYHRVS